MRTKDPIDRIIPARRSLPRHSLSRVLAVVATAFLGWTSVSAFAQVSQISNTGGVCGADVQGQDYKGCTAGEISISEVVDVVFAGGPLTECVAGDPLTIQSATVNYIINTQKRRDLIMWIGDQQGTDPRLSSGGGKSCSTYSLPGPFNPSPDPANPFGDIDGDQCGDLDATSLPSNAQASRVFTNIGAECQDNDGNGSADFQILLTWSQNDNQACGLGGGQSFPTVGSVSKCDFQLLDTGLTIVYPPVLELVKVVNNNNGGNGQATDWTLTATGPEVLSGPTGTSGEVAEGQYTLTESGPGGYTGTWSCVGGTFDGTDKITVANSTDPANRTVTCTLTNNDNPPGLTLLKNVTNNNGGNDPANSFNLNLTGADGTHDSGVDYSTGATPTVDANLQYTLHETPNSGYTLTSISCIDDNTQNPVGSDSNGDKLLTLALGQNVTCTFNNTDQAPSLTLIKNVINDSGGTSQPSDFTLTLQGTDGTHDTAQNYSSGATPSVKSNVSYTVDELDPGAGYTKTGVACVDTGNGNAPVSHPVTLNEGQQVTCTLTNDDVASGTITLIKSVTNDNGGSAQASDFALHIGGTGVTDPNCTGQSAATDRSSGYQIDPGINSCQYTVSETSKSGYTPTGISCVDKNNNDADAGNPFTFSAGQAIVCTIGNNDQPATLTLVKEVTNDSGGTSQVSDWTLTANGPTPITGKTGEGAVTGASVSAGDYTLSESGGPNGYTGTWNCVNTPIPVPQSEGAGKSKPQFSFTGPDQLTLVNGDDVTCTITNDDQPATLTLVKNLTNDDGGTGQVSDWQLIATGTGDNNTPISDDTAGWSGGKTVNADTYTLSESPDPGTNYTKGTWQCTGDGTLNGDQLTLGLNESATCTIGNDDDPPTLTLVKSVTNDSGGTLQASDFQITLTGADGTHDSGVNYKDGDTPSIRGTISYTVSETPPGGYELVDIVCRDAQQQVVGQGGTFTAVSGDDITCTVTNDDVLRNAFFTVTKDFSDDSTAEVEVFISCDAGTPLDRRKVISEDYGPVTFVLENVNKVLDANCDIFEKPVPDGYVPEYTDGADDGADLDLRFSDADGCHFRNVRGGQFYCDIFNELQPVDVVVNKEWEVVDPNVTVKLTADANYRCFNVWVDDQVTDISGGFSFEGQSDSQTIVGIYPHFSGASYCTVNEVQVPSYAEVDDRDCARVPISPGKGNSCTIYNTVFFEGIPTLNQYGLMILALLTLGIGFVGFRRFS